MVHPKGYMKLSIPPAQPLSRTPLQLWPSYLELHEEERSQEEGGSSSRGNWVVWQREHWCPSAEEGLKQEGAVGKKSALSGDDGIGPAL